MRRLTYFVPLILVALLGAYFFLGLQRDPSVIPSALLNQEVPEFDLAPIKGRKQGFKRDDLLRQPVLVNIFGSWCQACLVEHPFLMELKENDVIPIYGIDWREENRDAGPRWLKRHGDPYTLVGDDPKSLGAIAFGVTGAPETFIVDTMGLIRYKFSGPINRDVWEKELAPIVERLRNEEQPLSSKQVSTLK